jgi:hypothetical protein
MDSSTRPACTAPFSTMLFMALPVRDMLVAREVRDEQAGAEGAPSKAFCDDLLDYFDTDMQHPVSYQPTSACHLEDTYTRSSNSWMLADALDSTQVDPTRLRNATAFSSLLGHSHVLCDGAIYGQQVCTWCAPATG